MFLLMTTGVKSIMKFSTARWIAAILGISATVAITTYFMLDAKDRMIPFLALIIKPFMMMTLFPLVILLLAMLIAEQKKEEQVSGLVFKRSIVIVAALFCFKLFTRYFSN